MYQPSMRLGRLLKQEREKLGFTLSEIAQRTQNSVQHIHDIESGRRPMTPQRIKLWAEALNIDPSLIGVFILSEKKEDIERRAGIKFGIRILPEAAT